MFGWGEQAKKPTRDVFRHAIRLVDCRLQPCTFVRYMEDERTHAHNIQNKQEVAIFFHLKWRNIMTTAWQPLSASDFCTLILHFLFVRSCWQKFSWRFLRQVNSLSDKKQGGECKRLFQRWCGTISISYLVNVTLPESTWFNMLEERGDNSKDEVGLVAVTYRSGIFSC